MADQDKKILIQKTFDQVASGYDSDALRFFSLSAQRIPGYLGFKGNEQVLDVACGTGNASIELARALPDGSVTGVDFSEGMLAVAREKVAVRGLSNITFRQMDMESLTLPDKGFDAAVCAFGIFFIEDMPSQLKRIARKVRDQGKVLTTCFEGIPFGHLSDKFFKRLRLFGVDVDVESLMQLSSTSQCKELFKAGGLKDVRTEVFPAGYYLSDESMWWDIVWNAGLRRFVAGLPEGKRRDFQNEHLEEVRAAATDEGIWLDVQVICTIGTI